MNRFNFFVKKQMIRIMLCIIMILILVLVRRQTDSEIEFLSGFFQWFNERKFLAIYVTLYLISLFGQLKLIYDADRVIRNTDIWNHLSFIWKEIGVNAIIFAFLSTAGWYVIVGTAIKDCMNYRNIIYMCLIFFTQNIGWIEIGILATFIYSIVRNSPFTYILCHTTLILLNLSLYITNSEKFVQYSRIYYFMYELRQLNNWFTVISVAFLHIAIIFLLVFSTYSVVKKHDFISGDKNAYAQRRE